MIPVPALLVIIVNDIPRASGDDPKNEAGMIEQTAYSPRERG